MTLTPRLCSEIIRQRMGLKDDSQAARIINQIPAALKAFGRKVAADPYTRQLLTTDKGSTSIPITTGGKVNLVTGYDTWQFLLEYLDLGEMYFLAAADLTAVSSVSDTITIATFLADFAEADRVRFAGGTPPSGISFLTDYYLLNYDAETGITQLSTTADGSGLVNIGAGYVPTVTMTKQDPDGSPIQLLKSPQQAAVPRYLDSVFSYAYVEGNTLFLLPATKTGAVAFAVPFYPATLADLPDSEESERQFLDKLLEMCIQPGNDVAQDLQH